MQANLGEYNVQKQFRKFLPQNFEQQCTLYILLLFIYFRNLKDANQNYSFYHYMLYTGQTYSLINAQDKERQRKRGKGMTEIQAAAEAPVPDEQ